MSMEDILRVLVESRQPAQQKQTQSDPMTDLIGNLLGGGQSGQGQADPMAGMLGSLLGGGQTGQGQADTMAGMLGSLLGGGQTGQGQSDPMAGMLGSLLGGSQPQTSGGNQQMGLGTVMSLLEMVTGSGQQGLGQSSMMGSNPLLGLLQPFIEPLAKKLKISPELATIIISFVLQKLLAHHPTSGRDSTQFDLDDLLGQMQSGSINQGMLQNSGLAGELSRLTGMNEASATKSLDTAFNLIGQKVLGGTGASGSAASMSSLKTTPAPGRSVKGAASSAGRKIKRD